MVIKPVRSIHGFYTIITLLLIMMFAGACATTRPARIVRLSGFLGDYSQLHEGTGDEALLISINSRADYSRYHKIILDPIRIYPGVGDSFFRKMSPEDQHRMLDYFDATLRQKLGGDYSFVSEPGPDVMRIRIALTEADSANVPLDVVSSVVPIGIAASALKSVATGKGTGVGSAGAEFEVLDSQTGQRLAAAVDRRIGSKYTGRFDKLNRWRATQATFDHWAERLKVRLAEIRKSAEA